MYSVYTHVHMYIHAGSMQAVIGIPFSAMTLEAGFMRAESAVMGRRMGLVGSERSMITTCEVSPTFSLTQMNLSDSMVSVAKPICCTLMPAFWSWACVYVCVQ